MKVLGFSGVFGSGKNYLSSAITKELIAEGHTVLETTYAYSLKNDITDIIDLYRRGGTVEELALYMLSSVEQSEHVFNILKANGPITDSLNGWHKTPLTRSILQYYGTDIRRRQNPIYWVLRLRAEIAKIDADFIMIPDVRFVDEADNIKDYYNGKLFRLDIPHEVILKRLMERDGFVPPEDSPIFTHESETALNDYPRFDYFVGETFDSRELALKVL